jgi:predicted transcriptional regulator
VIDQRDHLTVVLLRAHHHLVRNHERNAPLVVDELIEQVHRVKSLKVVKSLIHAGFVLPHKSATNHVFVHASLNPIFLKMSQVKS